MKQINNTLPKAIENVGKDTYVYRWDIVQEEGTPAVMLDDAIITPSQERWSYNEVMVYSPISANKITERVIREVYGADIESKLINDYNAVLLGVLDESYKNKYVDFLESRRSLKEEIDAECEKFGIPKR